MRLLGRALLLLAVLPLVLWGARELWATVEAAWSPRGPDAVEGPGDVARTVPTYVLGDERWTVFPLAGGRDAIRLATHADVSPGDGVRPEWGWRYAVRYEILDGDGRVIGEGTRHYRAGLPRAQQRDGGDAYLTASYFGGEAIPTVRNTVTIGLADLPEQAAAIRLRVAGKDSGVKGVNARVYQPEAVADRGLAVTWQRMSGAERRRLAAGNVYPPQLLTEAEKKNLLRRRWQPVGPRGVEGQDYELRWLYVPPDGDGDSASDGGAAG